MSPLSLPRSLCRSAVRLVLPALLLVHGAQAADGLPATGLTPMPRIAIIIDDLGYRFAEGRRAIGLPGPVACAVLPATPRGSDLARLAAEAGKEVLLHLPLEAQNQVGFRDPGTLSMDMSRRQFAEAFATSLADVPQAIGVNNHRGSLLTRHPGHMTWLMEELRARKGLFFVDSYTTHHSVALSIAAEAGVPAIRRHVFLDNDRSAAGIATEFDRLLHLARRNGAAVGIGHPYPETLRFLEQMLPQLPREGVELVRISELLPY
ncbi:MAG: divergent polysaccharide deacetylase family protein [Woeseiaceae bacterium]|nr:divergent polysaccharide deacetylase family protein [Woeseiaceae bacterium]